MHQLILQTGQEPADDSTNSSLTLADKLQPKLRMIANAAGSLLPSLAIKLRDTFGANILPSYGMTECMPISSPPATYQLDKPGTSGVAVGPELAILNTTTVESLPFGEVGPVCVRGEPCFNGYGKIANDKSPTIVETFLKDGWFNTGDLGYMDKDGYLFITGRSKEVINRGGEIISPMEVEEAVLSHPDISACMAFSVPHSVLQEVVGIVIVMVAGRPRLDLPSLHAFVGDQLAAPKWPQCIVFVDGLPKSHTNKLLRVKLGERLGLPEFNDDMLPIERTFEAKCPAQGTALGVPIPSLKVTASAESVQNKLSKALVTKSGQLLIVKDHPIRKRALVCHVLGIDRVQAIEVAVDILDRYAVPSHFVVLSASAGLALPKPGDATAAILQNLSSTGPVDPLVQEVQHLFTELLGLDYAPGEKANFFNLGGSSMLASQLASKIRKRFGVPCSGSEIFHYSSCKDVAKLITERSEDVATSAASDLSGDHYSHNDNIIQTHGAPFPTKRLAPQRSWFASVMQFVPMFLVFPVWQVTRYLFFFHLLLSWIDFFTSETNVINFVIAYLVYHILWVTITPLIFVAIKWLVIGRYRAGRYPIWGSYYLRWWFVDICRKLFLRGVWGSNETLLNFYYRLLGAKIGEGARISLEADIAEFDLVSVGQNAAIEICTLRPFGVDNGAMILGPIRVGHNASVGVKSVVAPYTNIADDLHLGPLTSSYDIGKAFDDKYARVNRRALPEPNLWTQVCVVGPIAFFVNGFSQIPPLVVLYMMLGYKNYTGIIFHDFGGLMQWLCDPRRIPFYVGIRVARHILSPFFYMGAAIIVKKCVIGKFEAGPRNTSSQWHLLKLFLSATLFSRKKMQDVTDLVGRHYELVSVLYRLLGAKVGKRVFWPGHLPIFSGEFDLLEIGDDVVFGSRSGLLCTTVDTYEKIILCAGANVSDNTLVLPGSIVGKNAVLGSNTVCPQGWYLPEGSIWFGSKGCEPVCLESGSDSKFEGHMSAFEVKTNNLQLVGDETTLRPFGKAFYKNQATYFVFPLSWIILLSLVSQAFIAIFHSLPVLGALHAAAASLFGFHFYDRDYSLQCTFSSIYTRVLVFFFLMHFVRVFLWLAIDLAAKWTLMGQRRVGRYNYDTSDYAQRWEMYQLIGKLRKLNRLNLLDFFSGTPFLASFFRLHGCTIGKDVCLYPAGADPFMPEPDLVTIGDRCVVDCASIVCHLNTRGNFELSPILMENDCTLRARSRLQSAVQMEQGSQLLEKSLAMTGETLDSFSVWQGAPATLWFQYSVATVPQGNDGEHAEGEDKEYAHLLPYGTGPLYTYT
jgi:carbonic anhydrase/acetyltransferase-like protein (isoleucine patch superfamily)/acyl carrier protein